VWVGGLGELNPLLNFQPPEFYIFSPRGGLSPRPLFWLQVIFFAIKMHKTLCFLLENSQHFCLRKGHRPRPHPQWGRGTPWTPTSLWPEQLNLLSPPAAIFCQLTWSTLHVKCSLLSREPCCNNYYKIFIEKSNNITTEIWYNAINMYAGQSLT